MKLHLLFACQEGNWYNHLASIRGGEIPRRILPLCVAYGVLFYTEQIIN